MPPHTPRTSGAPTGRESTLFWVALTMLVVATHLTLAPLASDEAYLTLRLAKNLLHGGVPALNPGDQPLLYPGSPWLLLVTAITALFGDSLIMLALANAAMTMGVAYLCWRVLCLITQQTAFALEVVSAFLALAILIHPSAILTDAPMALLLIFCGLFSYLSQRASAFAFLTLAATMRIELSAFLLICLVENYLMRRLTLRTMWSGIAAAIVPGLALHLALGGSFPALSLVEMRCPDMGTFLSLVLRGLFGPFLFHNYPVLIMVIVATITCLLLIFALRHLHAPDFVIRDQRNLVILGGGILLLLLHSLLQTLLGPSDVPLYQLPILLSIFISSLVKEDRILQAIFFVVMLPLLFSLSRNLTAAFGMPSYFDGYSSGVRTMTYHRIGDIIAASCPHCTVMGDRIGALGDRFPGVIIKGSTSSRVAPPPEHLFAGFSIAPDRVGQYSPKVIVGSFNTLRSLRANVALSDYYLRRTIPLIIQDAPGNEVEILIRIGEGTQQLLEVFRRPTLGN